LSSELSPGFAVGFVWDAELAGEVPALVAVAAEPGFCAGSLACEPELFGFVAGVFSPVCCTSGVSVVAPLEISVRFPSPWSADSCGDTLEELSLQAMMNTDAMPTGIDLIISIEQPAKNISFIILQKIINSP
jgi:hypothetical protein